MLWTSSAPSCLSVLMIKAICTHCTMQTIHNLELMHNALIYLYLTADSFIHFYLDILCRIIPSLRESVIACNHRSTTITIWWVLIIICPIFLCISQVHLRHPRSDITGYAIPIPTVSFRVKTQTLVLELVKLK